MKTLFDATYVDKDIYPSYSTDNSAQNIDKQMNELFLTYSKMKKLEFYKNELSEKLKNYLLDKGIKKLENENGKLALIDMPHSHLSREALLELDVPLEIIELATNKKISQQLRINIR